MPVDLGIRGVAHALSVDETRIITDGPTTGVNGADGTDYFHARRSPLSAPGQLYFVGKNSGNDGVDYGHNDTNELVLTAARASDVTRRAKARIC